MLAMAKQFQAAGQTDQAIDTYIKILKKEPVLMLNDFYQYRRLFDNAKRMPDLADALLESDLSKMRNNYYNVLNVSENLMNDEATRDKGLALFKKTWDAFPDNRAYLIGNIDNVEVWKLPVMFEYARQGIIPQSDASVGRSPWAGIGDSLTYYGDGRVEGTLNRLMRGLKQGDRMATFKKEVEAALQKYPDWHGGKLILAVIETKTGAEKSAVQRIKEMLEDKDSGLTGRVAMVVAQELREGKGEVLQSGIRMMEFAVSNDSDNMHQQFEYSPGRTLVGMYANNGQRKKARDLMFKLLSDENYDRYGNNPGYAEYQRIQNNLAAGKQMLELDYPVEAMRLIGELNEGIFESAKRWGGSTDYYKRQVDDLRKKASAKITPEILVAVLEDSLSTEPAEPADDATTDDAEKSTAGKDNDKPQKKTNRPTLDFGMQPPQGTLDTLRMSAFLTDAFDQLKSSQDARQRIAKRITDLRKDRPDDPSLVLAAAMLDPTDNARLQQAVEFFKSAEAKSKNAKSDAADSNLQSAQISAWLIARSALKHKDTADLGQQLADLATTAARRDSNKQWLMSILRERGQLAMDAGQPDRAEQYWGEMLDMVLVKPKTDAKKSKSNSFLDELKKRLLPATGSKP